MISEGLRHFTEIPLSIVGMLLFIVTFITVTIWSFLSRQDLHEMAQMPLHEEEISHE